MPDTHTHTGPHIVRHTTTTGTKPYPTKWGRVHGSNAPLMIKRRLLKYFNVWCKIQLQK